MDLVLDQAYIMLVVPVVATSWRVALWFMFVALRKAGCDV